MLLIFIGVILVFLGAIRDTTQGKTEVRGGGVIVIGLIPIVFGTDTETVKALVILVIVLILVATMAMRWLR